ncbi:hypothetical protein ABEI56_05015 [Peribacillus castrilensis]|uniref:hypothetical protein n=1 Tax=Peribacillus TaxID=2675229 RepID=UPI0038713905
MTYLEPIEIQNIIDQVLSLGITESQWGTLSRRLNIEPTAVFSERFTSPERAEALVNKAVQLGKHQQLIEFAKELLTLAIHHHDDLLNISSLDTKIALKFGELYKELLYKLDEANRYTPNAQVANEPLLAEDFTDFKDKLKNKAHFSKSNQKLGIDSKNENTVLKRKARKLGYDKYGEINKRVRNYYNRRILTEYPPNTYNADFRLKVLVDELFVFLPEEFQDEEALDHLNGIVFDTTSQCWIFNE